MRPGAGTSLELPPDDLVTTSLCIWVVTSFGDVHSRDITEKKVTLVLCNCSYVQHRDCHSPQQTCSMHIRHSSSIFCLLYDVICPYLSVSRDT